MKARRGIEADSLSCRANSHIHAEASLIAVSTIFPPAFQAFAAGLFYRASGDEIFLPSRSVRFSLSQPEPGGSRFLMIIWCDPGGSQESNQELEEA